jgi:arylsulfatase A-like enzyme
LRADQRTGYPKNAVWRGLSAFEYFKLHGYATAYFSSQNEKWGDMDSWLKIPAVDTYFDSENFSGETWENEDDSAGLIRLIRSGVARAGKVEDSHTLDFAADWAERNVAEPFFLGLNLQNTHYHYYIPEQGERPFQPDQLGFRAVYAAWPKDQKPVVWNRYLNAVYNVDRALGHFIERLQRAGIWDRAVVLVVGDSGEAFYEHGYSNHSGPMYEEVARTLTLLKLPLGDQRNGERWTTPVSHVDLVPALADLAGLKPWPGFQGQAPWNRTGNNAVYMTANAIVREDSVVQWPWKMLWRRFPDRSLELYDLEQDPGETRNLVESLPGVAVRLQQDIESWRACQISYYADTKAHSRLQPPRYDNNVQAN